MLKQIALIPIFGIPLFMIFGMLAFLLFAFTTFIAYRNMKGDSRIPLRWHFHLAKVAIGLMIIHATLAFIVFFL